MNKEEFLKRYKFNPALLAQEHREIYDEYQKFLLIDYKIGRSINDFNNWLEAYAGEKLEDKK